MLFSWYIEFASTSVKKACLQSPSTDEECEDTEFLFRTDGTRLTPKKSESLIGMKILAFRTVDPDYAGAHDVENIDADFTGEVVSYSQLRVSECNGYITGVLGDEDQCYALEGTNSQCEVLAVIVRRASFSRLSRTAESHCGITLFQIVLQEAG